MQYIYNLGFNSDFLKKREYKNTYFEKMKECIHKMKKIVL